MMATVDQEVELQELRKKVAGLEQERARELAKRDAAWKVVRALSPTAHAFDRNLRGARDEAEAAQRRANAIERDIQKKRTQIGRILNPGFGFQEPADDD